MLKKKLCSGTKFLDIVECKVNHVHYSKWNRAAHERDKLKKWYSNHGIFYVASMIQNDDKWGKSDIYAFDVTKKIQIE